MKKIYIIAAILLLPLNISAEPLTLEQCRKMALDSSHTLQSAQHKIDQSQDMLGAYRTNRLPKLSLTGGYLYSTARLNEVIEGGYLPTFTPNFITGELKPNVGGFAPDGTPIFNSYAYMPDISFDLNVESVFTAGLQLTQPIYMGGKVTTAIKLAQIGVEVAEIEQSRSQNDVMVDVDKAFYTYLKVEEMATAADAYRKVVDELYRQVEKMVDGGMCTSNELLRVEVKINEAELSQLKAKNGLTLARMNLCYHIGMPITTSQLEVVDTFNLQLDIDPTLDITSRPEYALLAKSIEAKELELEMAKSDFRPTVAAMANYGYTNGVQLNDATLLASPSFTGGITIDMPLLHWGEGRRKISAARRDIAIAESTQADLTEKMQLELMQSINACIESQAEVALTTRSLEQSAENLRQVDKQYAAGMVTLSTQLEAQALWQKAMSDLTEAKSQLRLSYAHYCRTRGISPAL